MSGSRLRIGVAGFQHETNSFSPFGAGFADFEMADGWPELTRGAAILETFPDKTIPIGGFLRARNHHYVPSVWCSAEPSGPVSDDAYARISDIICNDIAQASRLDAIYLDLHGAMVTESIEDAEGTLLARLRTIVGPDLPIVVSLDMHANITEAMLRHASAMTIYRTYPHVDMVATGARCHKLLEAMLAGRPLFKAMRKLPFLLPLSAQCTEFEPLHAIYAGLPSMEDDSVVSVDLALGFPPADIAECGPAVLAYAHDQAAADRAADILVGKLLEAEPHFRNPLLSPAEAVARAMIRSSRTRPIVLADVQDNPGCGATSDTTGLLRALVTAGAQRVALAVLWDPDTAAAAHAAGQGAVLERQLGSRFGYDLTPFHGRFLVEQLGSGEIAGTGAIMAGGMMRIGRMARLRVLDTAADVEVVVGSVRFQCLDLELFRAMGIEPCHRSILAVKSTNHFRADFAPIAEEVLMVASPGAQPARIDLAAYERLRPGLRAAGVG